MIDLTKITNYNLNKYQLEEMIIFWLMVAGKKAKITAHYLEKMFCHLHQEYGVPDLRPFSVVKMYLKDHPDLLWLLLKNAGFGCYGTKARGLQELVNSDLDLSTCTVRDLEKIHSIGPKTARCFIMHSRADARLAGLDTHVLKWLASLGYKVPKGTPTGRVYIRLEAIFLKIADLLEKSPAVLDLAIWNAYSSGGRYKIEVAELPKQEN